MTVTESTPLYASENLISKSHRRHYRASVRPIHWQLRSLIGTGRDGVVYFPTGVGNLHLQRLDTKTLETETIHLLAFPPRCLVAQNGWVCCGGETGEFIAIQVEPSGSSRSNPRSDPAHLPPNVARNEASMRPFVRSSRTLSAAAHRNKRYGKDRVNCITLWFPSSFAGRLHADAYKSPVAVLANNDKHVTLVDLETMEALDELEYPDCVNRALLSPDGQLLIAVGDDPYLYVHKRVTVDQREISFLSGVVMRGWKRVRQVHLKSQRINDKSDHRGSFAACFSNTGAYLAVGTQYGVISIFDTEALLDAEQDALRAYFPSSRPAPVDRTGHNSSSTQGAVREMAFSPGPYDILAWSEDRGRAGVADLRTGFATRQILYLDAKDKNTEHLDLTDRSAIDPRLLDHGGNRDDTLATSLASTLDLSPDSADAARRRLEDRYHYPLTGEETQVLEALQEHRRRREQRVAAARELARHQAPTSTSATQSSTAPNAGEGRISATAALAGQYVQLRSLLADTERGVNEHRNFFAEFYMNTPEGRRVEALPRPIELQARARLLQREREAQTARNEEGAGQARPHTEVTLDFAQRFLREREEHMSPGSAVDRHFRDRYRASIGTVDPDATVRQTSGSAVTARERLTMTQLSEIRSRVGRQLADGPSSSAGPIGTAYRPSAGGWPGLDPVHGAASGQSANGRPSMSESPTADEEGTSRQPPYNAGTNTALRDYDPAWHYLLEHAGIPSNHPALASYQTGSSSYLVDNTAGLAWSVDGSILCVGAVNGIYEFRVDVSARKAIPSVQLR